MTFEQDLNQWCKETQDTIGNLKLVVERIKTQQKILLLMVGANIALDGVLIAAVLHL